MGRPIRLRISQRDQVKAESEVEEGNWADEQSVYVEPLCLLNRKLCMRNGENK